MYNRIFCRVVQKTNAFQKPAKGTTQYTAVHFTSFNRRVRNYNRKSLTKLHFGAKLHQHLMEVIVVTVEYCSPHHRDAFFPK